ncbi:MAG: hypothetical protein ISS90_02435 [Candidatus Omnitrophica bacterium]|nr:hypothetical protein [Candidatus Omnitrophota bacterium]
MHHTKHKGDLGLAKVIGDLIKKGHVPCVPLSEHQPYDLVAVLIDGSIIRLQVKYATLKNNGTVEVRFRRNWSDKKGVHTEWYNKNEFDYYAIYCPEKDVVLYVPNAPDCPKAIRFDRAANNQKQSVKWANDYLEIKRESSETIRHTPEMVKT